MRIQANAVQQRHNDYISELNLLSWVQSVDASGQKSEKTYQSGESMEITPLSLQALIIGNRKAITVLSPTGAEINVDEFTNPNTNVVRIIGAPVRNLGQNN
jgi:hypothetical protein